MSIFSSNTTYPLVVFRGTTATLLRAGGSTAPPGFPVENVVYTAVIDRAFYKLVSRFRLLHIEILIAVGRQMSIRIALELAAELKRNGTPSVNTPIMEKAASDMPLWVQQAGQGQKAGLPNVLRHAYPEEAKSSTWEDCKVEYLATSREFGLGALHAYSAVKGAVAA